MALRITRDLRREVAGHGEASYPYECCGALLGHAGAHGRTVRRLLTIDNARTDSACNRFLVTDRDYLRAEREAEAAGLALLGFYHSHPDHPARPSGTDLESAFPNFSYVIVAVAKGRAAEMTSWVLAEDRTAFVPEEMLEEAAERGR
jgi:proteasome lid subunit RPN8/RPN11